MGKSVEIHRGAGFHGQSPVLRKSLPGAVAFPAGEELQEGSSGLAAVVKSVLQLHGWIIPFLFHYHCRQETF